jgi:hypothetical protein
MFSEKNNEKQKPVVVLFAEYNLKIKNSLNVKVQQLWSTRVSLVYSETLTCFQKQKFSTKFICKK